MESVDPPQPTSKVNVDANFEKRLREVREHAAASAAALASGGQVRWFRPPGGGGVTDPPSLAVPFDRSQANDECVSAISDPQSPGTTGDVVAATTQIDVLACMQRAYASRHTMRGPRAAAHAAARMAGHGEQTGAVSLMVEYVRTVIQISRVE